MDAGPNLFVGTGLSTRISVVPDEPPAVEALFQATQGIPRKVNLLAHYALSAAALANARTVSAEHLQAALEDLAP